MLSPDAKAWKRPTTKQERKEAGAMLQALVDDAMLTQAEAADLLGVNHRTMTRYLLGQTAYPYSVWFAMVVLQEKKAAERPDPGNLRKLTLEDLNRELHKWRDAQLRCGNASRAYARAGEHICAILEEFIRRGEKPHDVRALPENEDVSARRRAGANKAWSDPAFRAGASERASQSGCDQASAKAGIAP